MFFPLGVDAEAYLKLTENTKVNKSHRIKLEKRMAELKKQIMISHVID